MRPDKANAAELVDGPRECRQVGETGQPLIVDWPAHQRGDLEESMLNGVAVVAYDCKQLRLLKDCRIEGSYGFLGLTRREEAFQLVDADEISANLPGFGVQLIADMGAELQRGRSLELAMVLAGKSRTTVPRASRQQLLGACSGATHFVRGAYIGAFALATGERGKARATAEIFGIGASAASDSRRKAQSREGDPKACDGIQPGDSRPPAGCRSAIRLELVGISEGGEPATPPTDVEQIKAANACPAGLVKVAGKCTFPSPEQVRTCTGADSTDCQTQCDKGDWTSCFILGSMYETGETVAQDFARASELYARSCAKGVPQGCNRLGVMHFYGSGVPQNAQRAVELFLSSCRAGYADACNNLGFVLDVGRGIARDSVKALALFEAACNGGEVPGCFNAGVLYDAGRGAAADKNKAQQYFERAQQGGVVDSFQFGCRYGNAYSCFGLGYMHQRGMFVSKDPAAAHGFFEKSCPGVEWGCEALGRPPSGK